MMTNRKNHGFTLVEILIVVVILGILAAIVIPQFSQASLEARESSLKSDLQAMRSQIQLYKIQHLEKFPGTVDGVTFRAAMTEKTDIDGNLWQTGDTDTPYGAYMRKVPVNPFNDEKDVDGHGTVRVGTAVITTASDTDSWYYSTDEGEIQADDLEVSPDNTAHVDL